jgi:3-deoxy-D-manno-octulosonic-acid transferase
LLAAGCAFSVDKAAALEAALAPLLRDRARCAELGRRARARIEAQAGAAQATFDALLTLLERPRGAP